MPTRGRLSGYPYSSPTARPEDLAVANGDHRAPRRVELDAGQSEGADETLGGTDPLAIDALDPHYGLGLAGRIEPGKTAYGVRWQSYASQEKALAAK